MYLILIAIVFIYLLSIFKRKRLHFFYFALGSIGMFCMCLFGLKDIISKYMIKFTTFLMGLIGQIFDTWMGYPNYGVIFIDNGLDCISLNIDYECSGVVEILVFVSLICFFPIYKRRKRFLFVIGGTLYIVLANLFRLTFICTAIYVYGNEAYYLSHTVIGRIVFFMFSIFLYFFTFTKAQINVQKVGNFDY